MKNALVVILALFLTSVAFGQTGQTNNCTGWIWKTGVDCDSTSRQLPDAPAPQQLTQPHTSSRRVVDRSFVAFAAVDIASAIADAEWSRRVIQDGNGCREVNPIIGVHAPVARTYGFILGTDAGMLFTTYLIKKHQQKNWTFLPVAATVVHFVGIKMTDSNCTGPHTF